jgi:hypothetical protein
MGYSIRQRADVVATFRHIAVYLMETLARWVPSTAELEVKVLFGRHIWDFAQHADALGKRTAELRAPLHYSLAPTDEFRRALDALAATTAAADRVAAVYDAFLPALEARYRAYLADTDPIVDEPTVRILERLLSDLARLRGDCERLRAERPDLPAADAQAVARLTALATGPAEFVRFRPAVEGAEVG